MNTDESNRAASVEIGSPSGGATVRAKEAYPGSMKSTVLRLDKPKPESLVVVRHLCFINKEDDIAIVNIVLCSYTMALASCMLDEDVGIKTVTTSWPRLYED